MAWSTCLCCHPGCCLTLRSTRRPPATRQGREAVRPIIGLAALALRWRSRVTSNVRRHAQEPVRPSGPPCEHPAGQDRACAGRPNWDEFKATCTGCALWRSSLIRLTSALRASVLRRAVSLSGSAQARCCNFVSQGARPCAFEAKHCPGSSQRLAVIGTQLRQSRGPAGCRSKCRLTLRSTRRPPAARQGREAVKAYHLPRGPGAPLAVARYLKR